MARPARRASGHAVHTGRHQQRQAIFLAAAFPVVVACSDRDQTTPARFGARQRGPLCQSLGWDPRGCAGKSGLEFVETAFSERATSVFQFAAAAFWRAGPLSGSACRLGCHLDRRLRRGLACPAIGNARSAARDRARVFLGLLALDIRYHPQNAIAVFNPLEHMFVGPRFPTRSSATPAASSAHASGRMSGMGYSMFWPG